MELQDKVVLVTGASMGIGRATALAFARAGAKLALAARSRDLLEALATEVRAQGQEALVIVADLRDPAQVHRMVDETVRHYGRLDVLVNNAGQSVAGRVTDLNLEFTREIMALNLYAPVIAIQAAAPVMRQQGGGLIINVSSMVSRMQIPGLAGYAASKAALNVIGDTARVELAGDNIRVVTVFPRLTATDFGQHALGDLALRQHQRTATPAPVDPPEHVAQRIVAAALAEPSEQYME